MKHINAFFSIILLAVLFSCGPIDPGESNKNKIDCSGYIYSNLGDRDFWSGEKCIWLEDNMILTSYDLKKISLNNFFQPYSVARQWYDSIINGNTRRTPWYTKLSIKKDKLICLLNGDPEKYNWKYLCIFEYDLKTGGIKQITDSVKNIQAVQYLTDTTLVYYQFDIPFNQGQGGYYLYNINSKQSLLLLRQNCNFDQQRFNNGFDISPDKTKMAIPVMNPMKYPKIVEYNFTTSKVDTMPVNFEIKQDIDSGFPVYRPCLWLRYSPNGGKLLYSNYPSNSLESYPNDSTQIGIIDLNNYGKKILHTGVGKAPLGSVDLFPEWSPNGENILYTTSPLSFEPYGIRGNSQLYILRNVFSQ